LTQAPIEIHRLREEQVGIGGLALSKLSRSSLWKNCPAKGLSVDRTGPPGAADDSREGAFQRLDDVLMMDLIPPLVASIASTALRSTRNASSPFRTRSSHRRSFRSAKPGRDIDKFAVFRLTPAPAERVGRLSWLSASPISNAAWLNKYNFFILEVVKA
jgi:hypothetical protein